MRGGGVGTEGGIRTEGEVLYTMRFLASIDHGGRRRPKDAMRPYSRCQSTQQSTTILYDRSTPLKLEKVLIIVMFIS